MADKNTPAPGFVDLGKQNASIAQKLINQDNLVNAPAETGPASEALDKLAAEASKKAGSEIPPGAVAPKETTPPEITPDDKQKSSDDKGTPPPVVDDEAKKKADAKAAEEAAARESADKMFKDSPQLPPGSSPKASEAFSSIKIKAAQEISAREAELETLRKEKAALEEKLKTPIPPEVETELNDHRAWRAKLDVEHDPKFKTFDKTVTAAQEFIYAQLQKSPKVTPAIIEEIKKFGGPENVNLGKLFESIQDPVMQRMVEAKVSDIEMAKFQKEQALKTVKDNIQQYMTERRKQFESSINAHTIETQKRTEPMLKQLDWFAEKPIDPKADEATRKAAEEHNQFISETKAQLAGALKDDSAQMRAILLVGMAQLFNLQRTSAADKKALESITKERDELKAKWDKVKESSTRLRETAAPSGGIPTPKPKDNFNTHASTALDDIAKQVMQERAAKAA